MSNLFGDILNVSMQVLDLAGQLGFDLVDADPASEGGDKGKGKRKRLVRRVSAAATGTYPVANFTFVAYPSGSEVIPTGGIIAYNTNDTPSNLIAAQSFGNSADSLVFECGPSGSPSGHVEVTDGFTYFPSGSLAVAPNGLSSGDPSTAGTEVVGGLSNVLCYSVTGLALGAVATIMRNYVTGASFQLTLGTASGTQYNFSLTYTSAMTGWQGQVSLTDQHGNSGSVTWVGGGATSETVDLPAGLRLDQGAASVQVTTQMPQQDFQALVAARRSQMRPVDEKTAERVRRAVKRLRA